MRTGTVGKLRDLLLERGEVVTAYLFGSAVDGPTTARDLDVAVVLRRGNLQEELALQAALEAALDVPVDLHAHDRLPIDMQARIHREGRVLVDRDPVARVRREVRVRSLADDFAPQLAIVRDGVRARLTGDG